MLATNISFIKARCVPSVLPAVMKAGTRGVQNQTCSQGLTQDIVGQGKEHKCLADSVQTCTLISLHVTILQMEK